MRVGVIGHGAIGRHLVDHILATDGLELSFVFTRGPLSAANVPPEASASQLTDELLGATDLVIEAAHPEIIAKHGERILEHADLMVVSAGGLVDDAQRERLITTARRHGRRIVVPHGALTGLESLAGRSSAWTAATITFVKPPSAFEPAPPDSGARSVLYDGPVRGVAARYPRNVNAMVTFALATAGLDDSRAVLVSDPAQSFATLDFEVTGADGGTLRVTKHQPLIGVSGSEMPDAIVHSLMTYAGGRAGLWFG
ncbi:aspartate dehydrogenase domain-containing protein [Agromyces sp. NPDC058484]|uniref:aspartate dehydrogenase domain-containing protein n=1 Tax=Agromyces sp. NPDC058484 TaxID=3346524 RepID=UPI003664808C